MTNAVDYKAPKVVSQFMQSNARLRVLHGPFRSGKSVGSMIEVMRRAAQQRPDKNGLRRSRWAIVRNTMPQLRDTTMKTWFDWFPDGSCGYWRETGKTFHIQTGDIRAEVMFRALDDASDVKNLLSLELTGAYINEARDIAREIVEALDGRINQYPKQVDGGCTWAGIWADTNPPEEGSYWHSMIEGLDPDTGHVRSNDWAVFKQPSGLIRVADGDQCEVVLRNGWRLRTNPDADNLVNLVPGYYSVLARDKSDEYVKVYIMAMYGQSKSGKPVHPLFDSTMHVGREILTPNRNLLLVIAADFGRTPAMSLMQQDMHGRVCVFDEIITQGMGIERAIREKLKPLLRNKYEGFDRFVTGDPSGQNGVQTDEKTCVTIFKAEGFNRIKFAATNNPIARWGGLDNFLARNTEVGPAFLVSPNCKQLIHALKGGYHFKINKTGITSDEPDKNMSSHIAESCEYGAMYFEKGISEAGDKDNREKALAATRSRGGSYTRRN